MQKSLTSGEKVNCSRQSEIDLLKAYPIVFTVIIHVCLILSISHPVSLFIKDTPAGSFAKQMSNHLTDIFVIQWILIGIVFSAFRTFEFPDIPLRRVIPVGVLFTLITGFLLPSLPKQETSAVIVYLL